MSKQSLSLPDAGRRAPIALTQGDGPTLFHVSQIRDDVLVGNGFYLVPIYEEMNAFP